MLTRQEMFDRAWNGLKGQGWLPAYNHRISTCEYLTGSGKRCAWGHVDPEGTEAIARAGYNGKGLAQLLDCLKDDAELAAKAPITASLDGVEGLFARALQSCHDDVALNNEMHPDEYVARQLEQAFRLFAEERGLTIPE